MIITDMASQREAVSQEIRSALEDVAKRMGLDPIWRD